MRNDSCDIITIDGESASGKSTTAEALALNLGYLHIDSGILFRTLGYFVDKYQLDLGSLAQSLDGRALMSEVQLIGLNVFHQGINISHEIQGEAAGLRAAELGKYEYFQNWFIQYLRDTVVQLKKPCIVSGRIGGTFIFPEARTKFFLTSKMQVKAERRFHQLQDEQHLKYRMEDILRSIHLRDDMQKILHYWKFTIPPDAIIIDTSFLNIDSVVKQCINAIYASSSKI